VLEENVKVMEFCAIYSGFNALENVQKNILQVRENANIIEAYMCLIGHKNF
jgi:hypothetical protein